MSCEIDFEQMTRALRTWFQPGEVFEIRILEALTKQWNSRAHTEAGYFDYEHIEEIPRQLDNLLAYKGIYVTVNPLNPAVLGRAANRFKRDKLIGAKDEEVARRRWLLIDCDAKRVSGVPSSEEEHAHALAKAEEIRAGLASMGWPEPISLDSGNGAQLMFRVDLPAQDDGLIKRCLEALSVCTDDRVEIDQTVFNPARIWRLPGAWNCKGDECPEQNRIHRPARILSLPEPLVCVSAAHLTALADSGQRAADSTQSDGEASVKNREVRILWPTVCPSRAARPDDCRLTTDDYQLSAPFSIDAFVAQHFPAAKAEAYNGGRKWVLDVCPFNADHNNRSAVITQAADGRLGFRCHHNGCLGKDWHALRALLEPENALPAPVANVDTSAFLDSLTTRQNGLYEHSDEPLALLPSLTELRERYPKRCAVIIEGLLRERETANIIAAPKTGKTWLIMQLALSIATGRSWMGRQCTPKRVLAIDNELQPEELVYRYTQVAEAMGITFEELEDRLYTYPQRGNLQPITSLGDILDSIRLRNIEVVIVDAFYRALPRGVDENSNTDIMALYNAIDVYAKSVNGAFILVHHTTKGSQVGKAVTDVGAGAGSQSRAADTHLVLLKHLEPGAVVLKGVTRSFPPIEPICLRQSFPIWQLDPTLDPRLLEGISDAERKKLLAQDTDPLTPEDTMTETTLPDLLQTLGGQCKKTAFCDYIRDRLALSRAKARSAIEAAIEAGAIIVNWSPDGRKDSILRLPEVTEKDIAEEPIGGDDEMV